MTTLIILVALSIFSLMFLGLSDPKRLGQRKTTNKLIVSRRYLVALALLPGLWLLINQEGAFFLIWLGVVTVTGWVLALLLKQSA